MPTDYFTKELSETYDARNSRLAPILENAHFLTGLVLKDLPARARALCVGVGTGAEILSLAREYPEMSFFGIDPSESMLEVCRARLEAAGIEDRCELFHGYLEDAPACEPFDAALSMLVGHFVEPELRRGYYGGMVKRLKTGGYVVNCEISADLECAEFPQMLENWKQVHSLMGASPESLAKLGETLRSSLSVVAPGEVEEYLRQSGVQPVRFFQSFLIVGWYGIKVS